MTYDPISNKYLEQETVGCEEIFPDDSSVDESRRDTEFEQRRHCRKNALKVSQDAAKRRNNDKNHVLGYPEIGLPVARTKTYRSLKLAKKTPNAKRSKK